MTTILGAGLAGLIAASTSFQDSPIIEKQTCDNFKKHRALLRFRSQAVGDSLGIDFKKVTVHKSIFFRGVHHSRCNPAFANMYSRKVMQGNVEDRSIWNTETCERWVAPDDLHERLIERCKDRIYWGREVGFDFGLPIEETYISTVPMPVLLRNREFPGFEFQDFSSSAIGVSRWKIKNCNTYQTVYFPSISHEMKHVYRASITGDILTIEFICLDSDKGETVPSFEFLYAFESLGLRRNEAEFIENSVQTLGKISKIDDRWRKNAIYELSSKHNIYSLGRFACWRQILLDDVLKDTQIIKKMINSGLYENRKVMLNE